MLYVGDSAAAMSALPHNSVKLFYGSPPYPNAKRDYGHFSGPDWLELMKRHMSAMIPALAPDGFIAINMKACREPAKKGLKSHRKRWLERLLIWVEDELPLWAVDDEIWSKTNSVTTGNRSCAQDAWEPIYVWARSNPWHWNEDAIRRPLSEASLQRYKYKYNPPATGLGYFSKTKNVEPNPLGALPINVVTGSVGTRTRGAIKHQARQPDYLPERYVKAFSNPGDLVFDPWLGSGTTAEVAARLDRIPGGCDVSEHYVSLVSAKLSVDFRLVVSL